MKVILEIIQIQTKPIINIHYNSKLKQSRIKSKYLNKNPNQAASLAIN